VRNVPPTFRSICLGAVCSLGAALTLIAAPPTVSTLEVRGLQIGKVNTLTFTGADLLPNPRLLTTARIARQSVKEGAKPDRITLEVELAPGSQPGLENWWLVTDGGVSARGILAADMLPQKSVADKIDTLPVALHGALTGSQVREVTFPGKAGQEIICEIEAQRLESKVRPVLDLYGPDNLLIQSSLPMQALRGDTRLEVKLPADGDYRLQLHDLQYAAVAPSHFRLKIGHWTYADLAYPPTVQRGVTTEVQLVGHAGETQTVRVSPSTEAAAVPAPWVDAGEASGPQAAVRLSDSPELVEDRTGSAPQVLTSLPAAVNGRISKPNEEDLYEFPVEPESDVDVEVTAEALGSPIDAELELRDLKGKQLAINDDTPAGPDPRLTFKVPKDVNRIVAVVRDVNGNGGPRCIYRLLIAPKAKEPPASYTLTMPEDSHTLQPGKTSVFKVEALRTGYDGPIDVAFEHLPDGVKVSGQTVPPQATATLLTLTAERDLPALITGLKGHAKSGETLARFDSAQLGQFQPWLVNDLALASAAESDVAFSAAWGDTAAAKKVVLSNKLTLPVVCRRPLGHDGPVRLTLLTSQARRFTKGVLDNTLNLREEKAVLIDEDKNAQTAYNAITTAEAALVAAQKAVETNKDEAAAEAIMKKMEAARATMETAKKAADDAAQKAKNDVEFAIVVPAELPEVPHQFAFKAELLKRDRKTVEAVAYTPVQELPVVNPVVVSMEAPAPIKLDPKSGASVELKGKVALLEGATGDVTVTLTGVPAGIPAPGAATVKAGTSDFKFALKLPANFKPGEYPDLKVAATGKPFGQLLVKTRETALKLTVVPPDPPAEVPATATANP